MVKPDEPMPDATEDDPSAKKKDTQGSKKKGTEEIVDPDADLSDEDLELKKSLELVVDRIQTGETTVKAAALEAVRREIREATTSMTSVPKPLKFLKPHYGVLKEALEEGVGGAENYAALADVISIMASTCAPSGERETLKYRLLGSGGDIGKGNWGVWEDMSGVCGVNESVWCGVVR